MEEVKVGNAVVKIYPVQNRGRDYASLSYHWAGKRVQKLIRISGAKDEQRVRKLARDIATQVWGARGDQIIDMNTDVRELRAARDALNGFEIQVDAACREYAAARKMIGDEGTLLDAAEAFRRSKPVAVAKASVGEVAEAFIEAQKLDGLSDRYHKETIRVLRLFTKDMVGRNIADLTTAQLQQWLRGLRREDGEPVALRTRNNIRSQIVTLFRWAQHEGYLRKDLKTEAEWLKKVQTTHTVHIFSVRDFRTLLYGAVEHDPRCIHYLAIGTMAFVRPKELDRLRDTNIRFEHNDIEIGDAQAKRTHRARNRRLIPMQPALRAWLEAFPPPRGKLIMRRTPDFVRKLAKKLGVQWHHDIMRHSGISYAVALTQNVDQVALWAGNSRQVIYESYLNQVTPAEAAELYGMMPPQRASNILSLTSA